MEDDRGAGGADADSEPETESRDKGNGPLKPTTCFICSADILSLIDGSFQNALGPDSSNSWTTIEAEDVSRCLHKLFDLELDHEEDSEDRLVHETYCTKCRELFDTVLVIYEQLDKLNRELDENKRKVQDQLRESYAKNLDSRPDSTETRLRLQEKLLNAEKSARAGKARNVRQHQNIPVSHSDCHFGTDNSYRDLQSNPISASAPELIEIKVEPIDHAWTHGNSPAEAEGIDSPQHDAYEDGVGHPDLPDYSDEEEHDTRELRHMTSAHVRLESLSRSRRMLKKKNYNEFFQDSEPDDFEIEIDEERTNDSTDTDDDCGQAVEDSGDDDEANLIGRRKKSRNERDREFHCKYCGKNCYCVSKLEKHESGHSDAKQFSCEVCQKPFKTRLAANNHVATHATPPEGPVEKPYHCKLCPNEYLSDRGLRKHVATFHQGKGRSKAQKSKKPKEKKVKAHTRKNKPDAATATTTAREEDNEANVCQVCGKTCKSSYDLKYHLESHKPDHERRHVCEECGKGFFKRSVLGRHKTVHHSANRDETHSGLSLCPICGKYVSTLKTHMRSHTGEKLFPCGICGRSFGTSESARVHARIHTGEKPYECATCGMRFRTAQAHRRHKTIHLNEKSHICDHCGKAFRLRQSLREHLHVHTKEAPHRCSICGRRFASTVLLSQHMDTDHTAEQIERKRQNSRRRKGEGEMEYLGLIQ